MVAEAAEKLKRPVIPPLPRATLGVRNPVISLDGVWKLNVQPSGAFWSATTDPETWCDVVVPGDLAAQGIATADDEEYAYRRRVAIPADFAGRRILLRFDSVSCAARVWIDGEYIRSHYGGFTTWYADVTGHVTPGRDADLVVGVTDKPDEISPFHRGGIIRGVRLVAFPEDYLTRLHVETDLTDDYRDAVLRVSAAMAFHAHDRGQVHLTLTDPRGDPVAISPDSIDLSRAHPAGNINVPIASPRTWDAEHPNLYTLEARVVVDGAIVETMSREVGFRAVEIRGNRLYVNGREVKLRGVNRHDVYPTTGRAVIPELVERDVRLFRDANVNFIRTSHYPPPEELLNACDRYGIYVEEETAVAFVGRTLRPTQNDPAFRSAYLDQFREMIERDRDHPCVILWSLANESFWGRNLGEQYEYAKAADPHRPTIYSYAITIPDGTRSCDVWSVHYARYDDDLAATIDTFFGQAWGRDLPVLHDEYAHVVCYNLNEQRRDPAVREFWGMALKRFWENIFTTAGALGGAIWAGIDDTMILPSGYIRAREWGIVDGWRREKPELWLTKKAYSPVRIADHELDVPACGNVLRIPIKNWFDHTNLNEIEVHWSVGNDAGVMSGPDVLPHSEGTLEIPAHAWRNGEVLNLTFFRTPDLVVDEFNLPIGTVDRSFPGPRGPAPHLHEADDSISVLGADFSLVFSRQTGLITSGTQRGSELITGGPYLNLVGIDLSEWALRSLRTRVEGDEAVVEIAGCYGAVVARFELRVDAHGLITVACIIDRPPAIPPRAKRVGLWFDVGGYREVGVSFVLASGVDRLRWERKALWSAYPEDHLGRSTGLARRIRTEGDEAYGERPSWPWSEDMRNYALFGRYDVGGRGTTDFRSTKHNIWYASIFQAGSSDQLRVESDGTAAIRLEVLDPPSARIDDRDAAVRYHGAWVHLDGESGSGCRTESYSNQVGAYAELAFRGTGVCWIGSKDLIFGKADVYVDGVKDASEIDLYCGSGHGVSRGEERIYRQVLFSKEGLPEREHTIRIVVTGQRNRGASGCYVSIDAFLVLGGPEAGNVRLNVNNEWNYPELSWGNYVKEPILIEPGYLNRVRLRLTDGPPTVPERPGSWCAPEPTSMSHTRGTTQ